MADTDVSLLTIGQVFVSKHTYEILLIYGIQTVNPDQKSIFFTIEICRTITHSYLKRRMKKIKIIHKQVFKTDIKSFQILCNCSISAMYLCSMYIHICKIKCEVVSISTFLLQIIKKNDFQCIIHDICVKYIVEA